MVCAGSDERPPETPEGSDAWDALHQGVDREELDSPARFTLDRATVLMRVRSVQAKSRSRRARPPQAQVDADQATTLIPAVPPEGREAVAPVPGRPAAPGGSAAGGVRRR